MTTAAIIPAYNERARIGRVLQTALATRGVDEVLVVVDGATDDTAQIAAQFAGVRVIPLTVNIGKGGAMAVGVQNTRADVLLFLDADLTGLEPRHLRAVLHPVQRGWCDMTVGIFHGGRFWSDTAQRFTPEFSGQRAMRREVFEAIRAPHEFRLGIEVALNHAAHRLDARVVRVMLDGVSHYHKEEKLGIVRGAAARAKMYAEMGRAMVRVRRYEKEDARARF